MRSNFFIINSQQLCHYAQWPFSAGPATDYCKKQQEMELKTILSFDWFPHILEKHTSSHYGSNPNRKIHFLLHDLGWPQLSAKTAWRKWLEKWAVNFRNLCQCSNWLQKNIPRPSSLMDATSTKKKVIFNIKLLLIFALRSYPSSLMKPFSMTWRNLLHDP